MAPQSLAMMKQARGLLASLARMSLNMITTDSFEILEAVLSVNVGARVVDGCEFTTRLEGVHNGPAVVSRTIAADFDTCERIIEVGTISENDYEKITSIEPLVSDTPVPSSYGPDSPTGESGSAGHVGGALQRPLMLETRSASFKTWWEDKIHWDVNWLQSNLSYQVDSANSKVIYVHGDSSCTRFWRSGSGWSDGGGTCTWGYGAGQSSVNVSADHEFNNSIFPCGIHTEWGDFSGYGAGTYYEDNIVGATLVSVWGTSTTTVSGECAHLLHKHDIAQAIAPMKAIGRAFWSGRHLRRFDIVYVGFSLFIGASLFWGIAACAQERTASPTETGVSATSSLVAGMGPFEMLERALAAAGNQTSYRIDYEHFAKAKEGDRVGITRYTGIGFFQSPDRSRFSLEAELTSDSVTTSWQTDTITIGRRHYRKGPESGNWITKDGEPATPLEVLTELPARITGLSYGLGTDDMLDGLPVHHIVAEGPVDESGTKHRIEYWVGRDDFLIRKFSHTIESPGEDEFHSTYRFSGYGGQVDIRAPEVSGNGENIVRFDNHGDGVVIRNPVRRVIKGERIDGNCVFSHRMEAPHGGSPRYSRPVWVNYDTCEQMIEEGEVSPEDSRKLSQTDAMRSETPEPATPQPNE